MLTIRLQRTGKKNQADFRIILAEKAAAASKKFIEVLGNYNPHKKDFRVKEERVKYWLAQNVECSPTVHNLMVTKGFLTVPKVKAFSVPKKPAAPVEAPVASAPAPEASPAPEVVPAPEATEPVVEEVKPAEEKTEVVA